MKMDQDKLEQLIQIQREMLRWIKFASAPQLKRTLETVLATDLDKRVYEMTDGNATTRSIAAALNIGKTTVARKWIAWGQLGIAEQLESGQYRRLCSLADVGIEVPQSEQAPPVPDENPGEAK